METSWNLFLSQQMNWIQAWQTGNWSTDDLLQVCESIIYLPLESFKDPLTIRLLITFQIITMCLWYSWQLLFPPIHTHVGVGIWQVCPFHLVYVLKPSVSYKTMKQERTCLIKILLLEMYAKWRASNRSSNRRFHPLPWECKGWQRDLHRTQNERNGDVPAFCCLESGATFGSLTWNKALGKVTVFTLPLEGSWLWTMQWQNECIFYRIPGKVDLAWMNL